MKRGQIQLFLLPAALILSGLIIGSAVYYNASQSAKFAQQGSPTPSQTATPTAPPVTQSVQPTVTATSQPTASPTPTLTDAQLLCNAVQVKTGIPVNKIECASSIVQSSVARGSVRNKDDDDGAAWFAGKTSGVWKIAYVGQGVPPCADLGSWPFPTTWISHCMNGTTVVQR